MRIITKEALPPESKTGPLKSSKVGWRFSTLTFLNKSNKLLALVLLVIIGILPAGFTNATFYSEASVTDNEFSAGCWVQPSTPELLTLSDNAIIHQGNSWLQNPLMTWTSSESTCPTADLKYKFEVASDPDFLNPVEVSDWIPDTQFVTSATESGEYYWHVLVQDMSSPTAPTSTSSARHYTVDLSNLEAPVNLGWNLPTQSTTPNEMPLDLVCGDVTDGGNPDAPTVAHNWTSVSGSNIKYQREVTYPDGVTTGSFYASTNYTPFSAFGSFPGIEGLWKTRVRAYEDDNNNSQIDQGERVSAFSNYCNLTLHKDIPQAPSPVVMNEILPDPLGADETALPFGEWIELYNRTDDPIDVAGWKLYADQNNEFPLIVSTDNTFAELPIPGTGTTTIQPHGFLVVYRNGNAQFDLKNIPTGVTDSETVRFFDSSDDLQDEHTYTNTRENKSITRDPDGADDWIDPVPTPGRPNVVDSMELSPSVIVAQQDVHNLFVALLDVYNYTSADITLNYKRVLDGQEQSEEVIKHVGIDVNTQFIPNIFLGSQSSGSQYAHEGIHNVHLSVILHGEHVPDRTVQSELSQPWRAE